MECLVVKCVAGVPCIPVQIRVESFVHCELQVLCPDGWRGGRTGLTDQRLTRVKLPRRQAAPVPRFCCDVIRIASPKGRHGIEAHPRMLMRSAGPTLSKQ